MDYAEAITLFYDEVDASLVRGQRRGLLDKEMADELRRIAEELEKSETRK